MSGQSRLIARWRRPRNDVVLLRHLSWRALLVLAVLVGCVVAPVVLAYLRVGGILGPAPTWTAFGDAAYLALRSLDVTNGHLPLVGSQSSVEGGTLIMQPGPAQFYAQAPFTTFFGGDVGALVFAGTTTVLAAVGCVWVVLRRFGVIGAVVGTAVVLAVEAQLGSRALVDSISSTHGQMPMLFAALATALAVAGDRRLFPAAVVALSYALQVHLSFLGYGLVLAPLLGVLVVVGVRQARRGDGRWFMGWAVAGLLLGALMWLPPLIDQFADTGNLSTIVSAGSGDSGVDGVPWNDRELASALAAAFGPVPALLASADAPLAFEFFGLNVAETIAGLAMGGAALAGGVALAVWGSLRGRALRRGAGGGASGVGHVAAADAGEAGHVDGSRDIADLGASEPQRVDAERRQAAAGMVLVVGVALALAGAFFASQLRGPAVFKPNNNRWMVLTGAVVWLGALVAPTASLRLQRLGRRAAQRMPKPTRWDGATVAGLLACVLAAGASAYVMTRPMGSSLDEPWLGFSPTITEDIAEAWGDRGPVRLYSPGANAAGGMQPAVMLGLEERGIDTQTVGGLEALRAGYGEHRLAEGDEPPYIQTQDGDIELPENGRLLRAVVARPVQEEPSRYQENVERCLERAQRAAEQITITPWGRRVLDDPVQAGNSPLDQFLVEGLKRPELLLLADLAPVALRRGYIEPVEVNVCSPEYQRELAAGFFMTVWLVE